MTISGVDFSHWQAKVDFAKLLINDVRFAIFKCGEIPLSSKQEYADDMYQRNIREANEHGLISGAYYFFHPSIGASRQARHFLNLIDLYGKPDLPLVIDVEVNDAMQPISASAVLRAMMDSLVEAGNTEIIIYTRWGLWVNQFGNPGWTTGYTHTCKDGSTVDVAVFLWLAQYNTQLTYKPADMSNVIMWQYTDRLRLPGVGVNLDGNKWLKTEAELLTMAGLDITPEVNFEHVPEPVVEHRPILNGWNDRSEDRSMLERIKRVLANRSGA